MVQIPLFLAAKLPILNFRGGVHSILSCAHSAVSTAVCHRNTFRPWWRVLRNSKTGVSVFAGFKLKAQFLCHDPSQIPPARDGGCNLRNLKNRIATLVWAIRPPRKISMLRLHLCTLGWNTKSRSRFPELFCSITSGYLYQMAEIAALVTGSDPKIVCLSWLAFEDIHGSNLFIPHSNNSRYATSKLKRSDFIFPLPYLPER
jgi:hypothetical protein